MAKNKYNFIVTDIEVLEKFAKNSVVVKKTPVRGMITRMLDAGVEVPGIEIVDADSLDAESEQSAPPANKPKPTEAQAPAAEAKGFISKTRQKAAAQIGSA